MGIELKRELAKILIDYNIILYEAEGEVSGSKLLEQIYERLDRKLCRYDDRDFKKRRKKEKRLF